ncbi:hypothetical protein IIA16_00285, partial [bacterium]|nr:hypothetical protein [bacterium]
MKRDNHNHRPRGAYPGVPPVRAAVNRPGARLPIGLALIGAIVHLMSPAVLPALPAFGVAPRPAVTGMIAPLAFIGGGGGSQVECWE